MLPVPTSLLFLLASFIWGTTWLTIKLQLGVVAPEVSVAYRFGLASLLLFGWCAIRRIPLRFNRAAHASFAVLGVLQYGANYVLVYASEGHLTSGLVAVIFVLVVAWNLLGSRFLLRNRLPPSAFVGAALGMVGIALVFWPSLSAVRNAPGQLWGVLFGVLASLCASAGNLWSERVYARGASVVSSTAWAMLYASIGVALYCLLRGLPFSFDGSFRYVASLAYLALFGSVLAFISFLTLLQRIGAARAGYVAVAIPVLAMVTSTVFEAFRWSLLTLAGMMLVLMGNIIVLRHKQRQAVRPRAAEEAAAAP